MLKTTFLFFVTVLYEIVGCLLPWLQLKRGATAWLLIPAGVSLAVFVWLLTLHPAAGGRIYVAYGGVCMVTALLWPRIVGDVKFGLYGWSGTLATLCGMLIIIAGQGRA